MKSLWTPLAIIIGAVVLVIGAKCIGQSIWVVLTAMGTIGVVLWAIFRDSILEFWRRPILQILPSEWEPPYFRPAPLVDSDNKRVGTSYAITIELENRGETLAKNCQPLLTGAGSKDKGKWQKEDNWLPLSLLWALDEASMQASGKPTEERDLVPHRPYSFNLGAVRTTDPDNLSISVIIYPTGQRTAFPPGEYCFEIKVFAATVKPICKYFYVQWDGKCSENHEEVKKKLRVFAKDVPPWRA